MKDNLGRLKPEKRGKKKEKYPPTVQAKAKHADLVQKSYIVQEQHNMSPD